MDGSTGSISLVTLTYTSYQGFFNCQPYRLSLRTESTSKAWYLGAMTLIGIRSIADYLESDHEAIYKKNISSDKSSQLEIQKYLRLLGEKSLIKHHLRQTELKFPKIPDKHKIIN